MAGEPALKRKIRSYQAQPLLVTNPTFSLWEEDADRDTVPRHSRVLTGF